MKNQDSPETLGKRGALCDTYTQVRPLPPMAQALLEARFRKPKASASKYGKRYFADVRWMIGPLPLSRFRTLGDLRRTGAGFFHRCGSDRTTAQRPGNLFRDRRLHASQPLHVFCGPGCCHSLRPGFGFEGGRSYTYRGVQLDRCFKSGPRQGNRFGLGGCPCARQTKRPRCVAGAAIDHSSQARRITALVESKGLTQCREKPPGILSCV
jgi:hypothetical protein